MSLGQLGSAQRLSSLDVHPTTWTVLCFGEESGGRPSPPIQLRVVPGALWAQLWEEPGCGHVHTGVTLPFQPLCQNNRLPGLQLLTQTCSVPCGQCWNVVGVSSEPKEEAPTGG